MSRHCGPLRPCTSTSGSGSSTANGLPLQNSVTSEISSVVLYYCCKYSTVILVTILAWRMYHLLIEAQTSFYVQKLYRTLSVLKIAARSRSMSSTHSLASWHLTDDLQLA